MNIDELTGKLVVVAHWEGFNLADATRLGILHKVQDGYFYVVGDPSGYRYCRLVGPAIIIAK